MSDDRSGSDVVEVETTEEEEEQQEEDLGVICEVCGTGLARKVLVLCNNYGPDHLLGCHTYCMAGDRWRTAGLKLDYFCTACSEYNKSVLKAVQDREEQRALQGGGVAHRKGKALEKMPELPPIHAPVRARHAAAVTMQPTAQMKIDRARTAAAEGTLDHAATPPAVAAAAAAAPAAAAAAAAPVAAAFGRGRGGGKQLQGLAGRGQPLKGRGPRALEPPKLRGQPQRQQQQQQQLNKEQHRPAANTFVKGLNQDKPGEVKAAQRSKKAAVEREQQQLRERERQKKEATAAAIAAGKRAREQQQQQQQQQPPGDVDAEYTVTIGQLAQISCQVVQAGVKATDDEAELHIMLDLKGHLKLCHPMEALASEQQRHIFRDEMIPELQQPNPGEDRKQLVGGVFDQNLHPSISRYNDSAELSYRPLKFVPVQNARISVQEQLKDRQRFIVVSLGQRLLVFLPTPGGELLLLLPRDAENTDDLVQEVVQSVMRDRNLGATPSQLEARAEQEREQNQQMSESAEGAHAKDPDDKEAVMDEVQQRLAAQPGGTDLQQQQQQEEQQQQLEPQGSVGRPRVQPDKQQQQQQRQQQVPLAQQPRSPQPVQQLPAGMTAAARQQQQDQEQQAQLEVAQAMVCMVEAVETPASHVLEQQQKQQPDKQQQDNQQQLQTAGLVVQQQAGQQQRQAHSPTLSPSAAPAAAAAAAATSRPPPAAHTAEVAAADRAALTGTVAKSAAGTRSGARSSARLGGSGGSAAVLEAVQNSTVARLLLRAAGPAAAAGSAAGGAAGQLSRRLIMPQLEDLVNVPQLRFYLLGFSLDSPGLLDSIAAAEALGATVHYKSQEQVLRALLDDLGLPADVAAAGVASAQQLPAAAAGAAAADKTAAAAAAAAGEGNRDDVIDLTAPDIGDTFCQSVVLVPEHTSPERLQELLGPGLLLWQLLAGKVAFFAQTSCKGPLSWLRRKHRQLQQRQQPQQQQAGSAAAGSGLVHAGNKRTRGGAAGSSVPWRRRVRQCSGGWQQEWAEEGEMQGLEGDEDSGSTVIRLPGKLRPYQLFGNGVAVLMETLGLSSVSKAQLQQLLALLSQGQAQQEEQWGTLDGDGEWSLLVARRTLEQELSASRKAMLRPQLAEGRVLVLDDVLVPDTLADEGEIDGALLQNALNLAQQRTAALRLVVVLLPDIDLAVQQQQQAGRGVQSAGGVSVGRAGGGSMSVDTSASEGCSRGTAGAAGGGGSYMPGSGTTGDDAGIVAEQQRLPRIPRTVVPSLRRQLEEANAQGSILAGTMRQVLQLLEAMVGRLQPGSTADM